MDSFLNSWGVTLIYVVLLGIGIIYAFLILLGAGMHDMHIPGLDIQMEGHDINLGHNIHVGQAEIGAGPEHQAVNVPSLSPVTIASFVTAFGAFGLISGGLFNVSSRDSLIWAAAGGLLIAAIAHFAFGFFLIAPQGSSEVRLNEIIGCKAEVTVSIPGDSVGEIAFIAQGGRMVYTAKSSNGKPIGRGLNVTIDKVIGGIAIVHSEDQPV